MSLLVADKLKKLLEGQPEAVERGIIVGREARNVVIVKTSHGVVRAVNTTVASRSGIPVVIAKMRQEWVVIGLDYFAYLDPPSYHTVPYHAEAHVMGHPDGSDDLVFLPKVQYLPLAVVPTSPPTRQVRICAGTFINLDGRIVESDERRFDFSSIIDGLSAGTNVLLGINRESGLAEVIMPDQAGGVTVPVTFIPLALVRLRPNQTEITWKEIIDVRELPSSRSGLSSLSELGDACITNPLGGDHLVWDEGTGCWTNEPNTLANLRDVNIFSPAEGDILTWDSNAGLWCNGPLPEMGIVSIDGVTNPGGDVDLVTSGAITLSPDNTNKRITIGETHSARTDNPHNTTAAQVGALVSVGGVSNPGGDVDLLAETGVTITPDNTNKRVTIGADLAYLDGRYVSASGDAITGPLGFRLGGSGPFYHRHVASYTIDSSNVTGAFVIETPIAAASEATMMRVLVEGYFYDSTSPFWLLVGGYIYSPDPSFHNYGYINLGKKRLLVRWGRNTVTGRVVLILGDVADAHRYPKLWVSLLEGYRGAKDAHRTGWSISLKTDLTGYDLLTTVPDVGAFWHADNDGAGSGLDADLVRGRNLAGELDAHVDRTDNPHNTTAAQVGALVSVDGVSSPGGDVDLVPGTGLTITPDNINKHVTVGADLNYLDERYVNTGGDTITGTLIVDATSAPNHLIARASPGISDQGGLILDQGSTYRFRAIVQGSGSATGIVNFRYEKQNKALGSATFNIDGFSSVKVGGNTVWHAGNDGAGSGLDADMLDGKHAGAFITGQGAGVRRTTAQSIPSGPWIPVSFDTVDWDSDGCWSSSEPTRLYCHTAGVYVISAIVQWAVNGNGTRTVGLSHNGTDVQYVLEPAPSPTYPTRQVINNILLMSVGDFIELRVYQDSGDDLIIDPYGGRGIKLAMARIG